MSEALDRSIAQIDFSPLAGQAVFLDTQYLIAVKGLGFVNAEYLISSLRQQMLAAGCLLQEKMETAEFIVEARCGALGADGHEVTYGMPASNGLSTVASLLPNAPPVPAIPEIAIAKKQDNRAAAKIGVFAYHRESRRPIWQSGISVSTSDAKDAWLLGVGPFQYGSIYDETQFAGGPLKLPLSDDGEPSRPPAVSYFHEMDFERQRRVAERQRKALMAEVERLGEIPELMPLTNMTLAESVARRLPTPDPPAEPAVAPPSETPSPAAAQPGTSAAAPAAEPAATPDPAKPAAASATAEPAAAPAATAPAATAPAATAPAAAAPTAPATATPATATPEPATGADAAG